jgi:hypothetical protein
MARGEVLERVEQAREEKLRAEEEPEGVER